MVSNLSCETHLSVVQMLHDASGNPNWALPQTTMGRPQIDKAWLLHGQNTYPTYKIQNTKLASWLMPIWMNAKMIALSPRLRTLNLMTQPMTELETFLHHPDLGRDVKSLF